MLAQNTLAAPIIFEAKNAMGSTQGNGQWYYMARNGNNYELMTKFSQNVTPTWRLCNDYPYVDKSFFYPNNTYDAVKKWVAHQEGMVTITGDISPVPAGSDGVIATVKLNNTVLWSSLVTDKPVTPGNLSNIYVTEGDAIYFEINKNGNMKNDKVRWEPVITMEKPAESVLLKAQDAIQLKGVSYQNGSITGFDQNDSFVFKNVLLGGYKTVKATLSSEVTGGSFEIRLDSINGSVLSKFVVCNTDGMNVFEEQYSEANSGLSGVHDLYVVGVSGQNIANINTIELLRIQPRGATMPFTTIEAESQVTTGKIYDKYTHPAPSADNSQHNYTMIEKAVQSASGKSYVQLDTTGQYIEFRVPKKSNKLLIRYTIPRGETGTIGLYKNNLYCADIELTSSNCYDTDEFYMRSFDEKTVDLDMNLGDRIMLKKDSKSRLAYYGIDLVEFEMVSPPEEMPDGYISVVDFGANPLDNEDDTAAIQNCLNYAKTVNKHVWFPPGRLIQYRKIEIPEGVNVRGSGIWHTQLFCPITGGTWGGPVGFYLNKNSVVADMTIRGASRSRNQQGIAIMGKNENLGINCIIDNVWFQNMTTAIGWTGFYNSTIKNCRIRGLYADAIHFGDYPQQNNVAFNNHIRGCGDDGIAVVIRTDFSEQLNRTATNLVAKFNTISATYWGRGMSVVGGTNVIYTDNIIDSVYNAGMIFTTEELSPSISTPIINVKFQRNTINNASHDMHNHAGIHFWLWTNYAKDIRIEVCDILNGSARGIQIDGGRYGDSSGRTQINYNNLYNNKWGSYYNGDPSRMSPVLNGNRGI